MSVVYEKTPLTEEKILFAIIDQTDLKEKHLHLFNKLYDITYTLTSRTACSLDKNIKFYENIDYAMLDSEGYDLVVIQNVGNFLKNNEFLLHLENYFYNNQDFFILGFVLDWPAEGKEGWLELHHQMLVVNPKTWKRLNCPKFGNWGESTEEIPNYSRSIENFHDKYTPFWVKGEDGHTVQTRNKQGWGFLKAALSSRMQLDNFTDEMRKCRLFVYPETDTDNLYKAFLNKDSSLVKNPNQKKWINELTPKSTIWIYNSENYKFDTDISSCDLYLGPAAGFKYLNALEHNSNIQFLFYDYNQISLEWINNIHQNWNGNDYTTFLNQQDINFSKRYKFINKTLENNQRILFENFGGEAQFQKLWNLFKNANPTYLLTDLFNLDNVKSLLNTVQCKKPFFYYSNIFATDFTVLNYSLAEVTIYHQNFLQIIKDRYPNSITYGCDPLGNWITT